MTEEQIDFLLGSAGTLSRLVWSTLAESWGCAVSLRDKGSGCLPYIVSITPDPMEA